MWLFILALYSTGIVTERPPNNYLHTGALNSTTTLYLTDYFICDIVEKCYEHFLETGNSTGFYCRVITQSWTSTATCLFTYNYCRRYCENMVNFTRPTSQFSRTPKFIVQSTRNKKPRTALAIFYQIILIE